MISIGGSAITEPSGCSSTPQVASTPEIGAQIGDRAVRAHQAMSCRGYSRSDFIVSAQGPIYLETNTLPGLTKASLYPKALKAQGIEFIDFLQGQIALAAKRAQK